MKRCNFCGEEKPFTEFDRDKANKDGYRHRCKACQAEYTKTHTRKPETEEQRARRRENARAYRAANLEAVRASNRASYHRNKDKHREKGSRAPEAAQQMSNRRVK